MQPNRTYHFDRHAGDVILRMLLVMMLLPSMLVSWLCWTRFDETLEGLFERNISLKVQLILKRQDKTGYSASTLFQEIEARRLRDGKGVLSYPDYLLKAGLDDKDPDLTAVRLYIFSHRIAMYVVAVFFSLLSLFLAYAVLVSYGSGEYQWRVNRWIFSFFNTDFHAIAPRVGVEGLSGFKKAIFDIAFRRALASSDGEFLFAEDEFLRALGLHGSGDTARDDASRNRLFVTFRDLVDRIHRFSFTRGTQRICREYRLFIPVDGKVTEVETRIDGVERRVYRAGVFQLHPRLFKALRPWYTFVEKLSPGAFSIDHDAHPYAYPVYQVLFSYRFFIGEGKFRELVQNGKLTLSLVRLLDEAGFELPDQGLRDMLADFQADLDHLAGRKLIESWEVRDRGIPLAKDWFEAVKTFSYDPDRRAYRSGSEIVADKVYCFEIGLPVHPELPTGHEVKRLPASTVPTPSSMPAPVETPEGNGGEEPAGDVRQDEDGGTPPAGTEAGNQDGAGESVPMDGPDTEPTQDERNDRPVSAGQEVPDEGRPGEGGHGGQGDPAQDHQTGPRNPLDDETH